VHLYITENMNQIYSRIPCFVENLYIYIYIYMVYQNKIYGFLLEVHTTPTLPKTMCLGILSSSLDLPSLGSPKSHHHDLKPTRIQNSKLTKFLNQSLS